MKSYRHYIFAFRLFCLCAVASLAGCSDMDDDLPVTTQEEGTYVKVTRLAIPVPDEETEESVTVNSVRILLFNPNDGYKLTANHLVPTFSKEYEYWSESGADSKKHVIITPYTTDQSKLALKANPGKNLIYIVLNEKDGFGTDLSSGLNGLTAGTATRTELETILKNTVTYSKLIPVGEDAKTDEPAFVMCTYDEIDLSEIDKGTASGTEEDPVTIDMTGRMSADEGFGMRRPMAKITFDGFYGGVNVSAADKLRNVEEGTDWRALLEPTDTLSATNDKEKELLTALSAIHVLDMQLVNVPQGYSFWDAENAEGDFDYNGEHNGNDRPVYDGVYNEPFALYQDNDFQRENGYLDREWPGQIKVSGTVPFTANAYLPGVYKIEAASGSQSYSTEFTSYGKLTGDQTVPTLMEGTDINDRSTSGPYSLNKGNFDSWFLSWFTGNGGNHEYTQIDVTVGDINPEFSLKPAVWSMKQGKWSYYVPENISESKPTAIRLTISMGTPSVAEFDMDEIHKIIEQMIKDGKFELSGNTDLPTGSGGQVTQDRMDIVRNLGRLCYEKRVNNVPVDTVIYEPNEQNNRYDASTRLFDDWKSVAQGGTGFIDKTNNVSVNWGVMYSGIHTVISDGTGSDDTVYRVEDEVGKYIHIRQEEAKQVFTIDIPLNNAQNAEDENGRKDHNIYRGHEYRVQLFLTGKPDAAGGWTEIKNAATRAVGGIGLGIAARVERVPVK